MPRNLWDVRTELGRLPLNGHNADSVGTVPVRGVSYSYAEPHDAQGAVMSATNPRQPKMDRVMFRTDRDGDVFALLIDRNEGDNRVLIFTPHGHTSGPYEDNIRSSRAAKPEEYERMVQQMKRAGYRLKIVQRVTTARETPRRLDPFTRQYIETAIWSSSDNADESGGEPLDKNYGPDDIASETMEKMVEDAADFQKRYAKLLADSGLDDEKAGHDFWLSRNGHGSGFFDEGDGLDELQAAAEGYGVFELDVGDDGLIYGPPPGAYGVREASRRTRKPEPEYNPKGYYLSRSEGRYRIIYHGSPIAADVDSIERVMQISRSFAVPVHLDPMAWDGDAGTWVPLTEMRETSSRGVRLRQGVEERLYAFAAGGTKPYFSPASGEVGYGYAVKIDGFDFARAPFGERIAVTDKFKETARRDWISTKRRANQKPLTEIKRWIAVVEPDQFYAKWATYVDDDSVQIWYTKS